MGLAVCDHCRGTVADNAPHCPHCGAPQRGARESSFIEFLRQLWKQESTRDYLPLFLGAGLGIGLVFGLHAWLDRPGATLDAFTLGWQVALGALVGCLLGALLKKV